jgi:5-methylcytosine-specific restriction endonuclease McrA
MITEEEFYKEKIFNKVSKNDLKQKNLNQARLIDCWYRSDRYIKIQDYKSRLTAKFYQMTLADEVQIELTNDKLYELFCWWERQEKKCFYCNLPETELDILHNQPGHINKRHPNRGQSLEIDRKFSHLPYTDIKNLVLACYWCNNAKTDTFTETEFRKIGNVIKEIWENRLNKQLL